MGTTPVLKPSEVAAEKLALEQQVEQVRSTGAEG
jgi:hypothetical protein